MVMGAARFIALIMCGFTCVAGETLAATVAGTFQQIDCDGGGWFEQVIPHGSGRLYERTDIGGMYRSDDHGDTWRFISGDLPYVGCYFVQGVAVAVGNVTLFIRHEPFRRRCQREQDCQCDGRFTEQTAIRYWDKCCEFSRRRCC